VQLQKMCAGKGWALVRMREEVVAEEVVAEEVLAEEVVAERWQQCIPM
jgi:hypothetical protein